MENQEEMEEMEIREAMIRSLEYDFTVFWSETAGLSGDEEVVFAITDLLDKALEVSFTDSIAVTPEGPFLEGSEYDGASVAWAVNFLYGTEPDIIGDLPSMKDLGLDYSSNFDEDGNPRVR